MMPGAQELTFALLTVICLSATADLQNAVVNGYFGGQKDENRLVETRPAFEQANQKIWVLGRKEKDGFFESSVSGQMNVPGLPLGENYSEEGRVGLAFYLKRASSGPADPSLECFLKLDDFQVIQFPVPDDWQPRIVDLKPWAGRTVRLWVSSTSLSDGSGEALLALPRLIAWHGPYQNGGGLMVRGPHGSSQISNPATTPDGRPIESRTRPFRVDPSKMSAPPLLMTRVDFVTQGTVRLVSEVEDYTAVMNRGFYWLPLRMGASPTGQLHNIEGTMESGPMDIIPDFMGDDGAHLRELEKQIQQDSQKPAE